MIFTLEILQANHGDCLLLHYGAKANPEIILIDGGPTGIYDNHLRPRLLEIKENRQLDSPLTLSMVMVSHMDDDHANGICRLTDDVIADDNQSPVAINHIWINTFDDIIGNIEVPQISSLAATSSAANISALGIPQFQEAGEHIVAVIASTSQGRQLRDNANALSLTVNHPFTSLEDGGAVLVRGDSNQPPVSFEGLKLTVVTPDEKRLVALQKQWDKDLRTAKEKGDDSIIFASLTNSDTSPFNLSSITCLVEKGNKRILLTGDARSDDILEGLATNGLLNDGKLHVDILKMPHHGSIRNMNEEFLRKITADHYVISANGRDDNPDRELLNLLVKTVRKGKVYLTNRTGKKTIKEDVDFFLQKIESSGSKINVEILPAGQSSFQINLGEPITF